MCRADGLQVLSDIELRLQRGQASDALERLRMSIHIWNYNFGMKQNEVWGQKQNTWAQHFLNTLRKDINTAAGTYRRAQDALLCLGMDVNDVMF